MTSISQLFNDKTQDVASLPPFYYMLDALRMYFHDKLPLTETQFATLAGLLTPRR